MKQKQHRLQMPVQLSDQIEFKSYILKMKFHIHFSQILKPEQMKIDWFLVRKMEQPYLRMLIISQSIFKHFWYLVFEVFYSPRDKELKMLSKPKIKFFLILLKFDLQQQDWIFYYQINITDSRITMIRLLFKESILINFSMNKEWKLSTYLERSWDSISDRS